MSAEPYLDEAWLHDLGLAEGIDHLVDTELLDHTHHGQTEGGCCVICGDDAESLRRVPDGDACPDCFDAVNDALRDVCATFGCLEVPLRDSDECKMCDQFDERAFRL